MRARKVQTVYLLINEACIDGDMTSEISVFDTFEKASTVAQEWIKKSLEDCPEAVNAESKDYNMEDNKYYYYKTDNEITVFLQGDYNTYYNTVYILERIVN